MHVQIVDGNDTNLVLLEQIIRRVSTEPTIEGFTNPNAALETCRRTLPDLILIDSGISGIDVHEFVTHVRDISGAEELLIVMVTEAHEGSVRHRALENGVTDFLFRPIDPSEVQARLTNLLELHRSRQTLKGQGQWLAEEVLNATRAITEQEQDLILRLSKAAEFRNPDTGGHILRMAHYSYLIAVKMGLPRDYCDLILEVAPMHDIGKLGIPDGILLKPGRLDKDEYEIMKRHAQIGHSILAGSSSPLIRLGAEITLTHHEKFDGSGYPKGLPAESIPLSGRIVAVADVFDALTSERPYKKAWSLDRACEFLLNERGRHFDPVCVDMLVGGWDEVLVIHSRFTDTMVDAQDLEQMIS
ncbi:MAG: HD domain-containing protein [Alphaproteobacteria bacterium]|nr:HD domain-containing protein [Alphaproteobacteria bacterium]